MSEPGDPYSLRHRLQHIYWIGGGSGAGKSTTARRIAFKHSLHLYSTDETMADHQRRSSPENIPLLTKFLQMTMDERWLDRPPTAMLDSFHWFRGEAFELIVEDLLKLPPNKGVIVEGFRLLPKNVMPLLLDPKKAVWLIPTPKFRRAAFESRGSLWDIANKTSNPARALRNLLERDELFTTRLHETAKSARLPVIKVRSTMTEDVLEEKIARQFQLSTQVSS